MKRNFTRILAALALLVGLTIPMGVWGQTMTDVIDHDATVSNLGNTGTSSWATNFSIEGNSGAVYYIHSMGTKDTQNALQWNTNGFLYMTSTCEGYQLKSVTITTTANKNIGVYAQNTAYSAAPSGAALATLAATSSGATYEFTQAYSYLALKGTASSTSITNITIVWKETTGTSTYSVTYNANGGSGEMVDGNSPYEANETVTLLENTFIAPESMMWDSWLVKDAEDHTISVNNNKFTMPASDVTVTANWVADPNATQYEWVLTDLADLTSSDIFVIVGNNGSNYAMTNNNGTASAPAASSVNVTNERITSIVSDVIKWNISGNATDGYVFYPNGDNEKWLYCTNTNNGVRVGTNTNKTFVVDATSGYLKHVGTSRYVGVYNSEDWRCYTSAGGNIANQTFAFYKRQVVSTDPYITADDVELEYDDTEGTITYVLHNATGSITATTTAAWITSLTPNASTSTVAIVCEANNSNEPREATVVLAYGEATKDITVTQAANPNAPLTTMDEIFARATEVGNTATDVTITFNNWVVTGANTSSHTFVSDGTKGFMIYGSDHGFAAGNILSGTVQCKVQLYNGAAEITELNSTTTGLTVTTGGEVTIADIAMANLAGINTGALVHYENLTCSISTSGQYTNYYLTDGTTQIQAYHTIIGSLADLLENGKTYNITGVFVQNNSTKRILPRSADDIVEVEVTEPNTITAGTLTHVSIDELWDGDTFEDIELDSEVAVGTTVYFSLTVEEGYTLESVSVLDANNEEVTLTEASESWYFIMPNNSVTINARATESSVTPVTGDKYVKVTSTTGLTSGQYLIVYEEGSVAFNGGLETLDAVGNTIEVTLNNNAIAVTDATAAAEFTIDMIAGTIKSASGFYIGQTSDANGMKTSTTEAYENAISIGEDGANIVSSSAHLRYNSASNQTRFRYYKSASYTDQKAIQLYKKEATPTGPTITVNGYGDTDGGYVLLAWPESTSPANIEGMISDNLGTQVTPENPGTYDLYSYDESQEKEWLNYRTNNFELVPGKGYLYASKAGVTLTYEGEASPVFADVNLPYTENKIVKSIYLAGNSQTNEQTFYVYNGELAKQSFNYLTMNEDGNGFISAQATSYTAPAMTGFFVQAPGANMTLSTTDVNAKANVSLLNINVLRNRGSVIDNAIVSFSNGSMMDKFYLMNNTTRVYIPQGNREMAIANSAAQGEMPVSFRASENGTYTIAVEAENVDMNYLHLIDNMTGADVDLLATPNYTFEARTNDYTSRFRLVFSANGIDDQTAETFAYFNGTNWTVSNTGDATLQVVDITGRIVSSETINGNATVSINQPAGIYMLRLVNGNDVKVQKVVVR